MIGEVNLFHKYKYVVGTVSANGFYSRYNESINLKLIDLGCVAKEGRETYIYN